MIEGAPVSGAVYGANGQTVAGAAISVDSIQAATADAGGNYQMRVLTLGQHNIRASKAGFRSLTQSLTVTDMGASYTLDFKGNTGLVPDAPDLSFVLNCINKWKFPPDGGTAWIYPRY